MTERDARSFKEIEAVRCTVRDSIEDLENGICDLLPATEISRTMALAAVAFFKATEATMKAIDEIDKSKSSGNGRSLAIARTKLDECALWTNAALEAERLSTKLSKVKNVLED